MKTQIGPWTCPAIETVEECIDDLGYPARISHISKPPIFGLRNAVRHFHKIIEQQVRFRNYDIIQEIGNPNDVPGIVTDALIGRVPVMPLAKDINHFPI